MNQDTLLHRQVHPNFTRNGEATPQAFTPTPKDNKSQATAPVRKHPWLAFPSRSVILEGFPKTHVHLRRLNLLMSPSHTLSQLVSTVVLIVGRVVAVKKQSGQVHSPLHQSLAQRIQ